MLLQLALEGQSSLARALLPTAQSNHAPAICPSMLLPFCRSCYKPNMLLPFCQADQRWDVNPAGHSTATMLLTFCRFLQNNQRFYLFKHVRKAKLRLFCQAVQTQSSHDPMIPCTVEQADFVCRMYTCICMYQHTCIHEHSQREVMLKQTKINIPWQEHYPVSDSMWTSWFILLKLHHTF